MHNAKIMRHTSEEAQDDVRRTVIQVIATTGITLLIGGGILWYVYVNRAAPTPLAAIMPVDKASLGTSSSWPTPNTAATYAPVPMVLVSPRVAIDKAALDKQKQDDLDKPKVNPQGYHDDMKTFVDTVNYSDCAAIWPHDGHLNVVGVVAPDNFVMSGYGWTSDITIDTMEQRKTYVKVLGDRFSDIRNRNGQIGPCQVIVRFLPSDLVITDTFR